MTNYNFSDLENKVVVIVGGFGLIGKEISKGFMKNNSHVVIASRSNKDPSFLSLLRKMGKGKISFFPLDTSKEEEIDSLIKHIKKNLKKIDVFVNCSWPKTKDWGVDIENVPFTSIKENLLLQLGSYYNLTQKIALLMKKQKYGSIINFSSIYGLVAPTFSVYEGTKMTSPPAYPLVKGGINMMTRYFASYFGKYNVRVNCISPGGVYRNEDPKFVKKYSEITPLGRMAYPEDLVMPTLFLASEGSKYITGHNLLVDGGWTIH